MHDLVVVGGGILGLATARAFLADHAGADVLVLEAEARVAAHQSSHNSGVLHAGVYYRPGSRKARWCIRGRRRLDEYATAHGIPVLRCGKVVVATDRGELPRLEELERRARANGVPGLQRLDAHGLTEVEPHVAGIAALHSPATAVVDFGAVTRALARDVAAAGGRVRTLAPVTAIAVHDDRVRLDTPADTVTARRAVTCAGLQSDRVAALTGDAGGLRIVPFRGTWSLLVPPAADLVRGNVCPVPDPAYPFLGVHLTPHPDGTVRVGPNAVLAGARDAYRRGAISVADLADTARHPGTWALAATHAVPGLRELWHDRAPGWYARQVRRYLPAVTPDDLRPGPCGVRAQLVDRRGRLVDDFVVARHGPVVHVRNAPSPAATASLEIADEICRRLAEPARG